MSVYVSVCYRESDEGMLDDFEEEVEKKGEMTEAKKEMFTHLKKTKEDVKTKTDTKDKKNTVNTCCITLFINQASYELC